MFGQFVVHLDYMLSAPTARRPALRTVWAPPATVAAPGACRRRASSIEFRDVRPEKGPTPGSQPRQRRTEVVNFSVTEENPRNGTPACTGVPRPAHPARGPACTSPACLRTVRAAHVRNTRCRQRPRRQPAREAAGCPAHAASRRPSAPPANGPDAGQPRSRRAGRAPGLLRQRRESAAAGTAAASAKKARTAGTAAAATAALAGSEGRLGKTSQLGGRIRRQGPKRLGVAAAVLVVLRFWSGGLWPLCRQPEAVRGGRSPAPAASSAAPASRGALPLEGRQPPGLPAAGLLQGLRPGCATVHRRGLRHRPLGAAGRGGKIPASDAYPGRDQLKQKATRRAARRLPLTAKAGDYDLSYKLAYPSPRSWEMGDRRVDCYVPRERRKRHQGVPGP